MVAGTYAPLWNVPYQRNPFFTGREDILSHLHRALYVENAVALSHPQGISGLGGIGKTQTALEYAYRYAANYQAVLWVRADSLLALTSSFVELARVLELPERDEQDQRIIVAAVLRWLRQNSQWLLIFDNMDNPPIAEPFLPKAGPGHILFTTRAHSFAEIAQLLEVKQMEPETGALLLLRRASIVRLRTLLEAATRNERDIACAISQELDGLPLALDQAGAYMKETPYPLSDYLSLYQQRRSELLQKRGELNKDYPASVATTWSLSFEKMTRANAASAELLHFCAFLAPDAIPEEIFTIGVPHLGKILAPVATDPLQFDRACQDALRFSLIAREPDTQILTIHRLVQAVLRDNMSIKTQQQWMRRVIPSVNASFPDVEFKNWLTIERLLPHALICSIWIEQTSLTTLPARRLLNNSGLYLKDHARYSEAETLLKNALAIYEQFGGVTYYILNTAISLNNLAALYDQQGRYSEAELLFQRALSIQKQRLGSMDIGTAYTLHNLALLYKHQGKYMEAEPLFQQTLAIYEQKLGPMHRDTATSLNGLAELYRNQGRLTEAEPLLKRALSIRECQLDAQDPSLALSLNNLAGLYHNQGKYEQAEPLYVRALAIREKQLGTNHPETATSLLNLAALYGDQERYELAEPLLVRALAIDEQVYGLDHHEIATDLNSLAAFYRVQGRFAEAEPLLKRALSLQEQQLGAQHPSLAPTLNDLAFLYRHQGKYEQAEPLYMRALAIQEQILGTEHPQTARTLNNLAVLYEIQEKYEQAEPLYVRVLAIQEQKLGTEHPTTAASLNNLASLYDKQGMYTEAAPLYQRALSIAKERLGTTHSLTQTIQESYARLLQNNASLSDSEFVEPIKKMAPDLATTYNELLELISRLKSTLQVARSAQENRDRLSEFTDTARNVLIFAQEEAQGFRHDYIGTEHLLLGLVRENEGVASRALHSLGIELPEVRNTVDSLIDRRDRIVPGKVSLTPHMKKVLELSIDEARLHHHHFISTEHLLLGLIREGDGLGTQVLEALGVGLNEIRMQIVHLLNQPDQAVSRLMEEAHYLLAQTSRQREEASLRQAGEIITELRDREMELRNCLAKFESEWFREQEQ